MTWNKREWDLYNNCFRANYFPSPSLLFAKKRIICFVRANLSNLRLATKVSCRRKFIFFILINYLSVTEERELNTTQLWGIFLNRHSFFGACCRNKAETNLKLELKERKPLYFLYWPTEWSFEEEVYLNVNYKKTAGFLRTYSRQNPIGFHFILLADPFQLFYILYFDLL